MSLEGFGSVLDLQIELFHTVLLFLENCGVRQDLLNANAFYIRDIDGAYSQETLDVELVHRPSGLVVGVVSSFYGCDGYLVKFTTTKDAGTVIDLGFCNEYTGE